MKDGRVAVEYDRPYKTFTCVTEYYVNSDGATENIFSTGPGSAVGKPYDIRVYLETRNIT